MDDEFEAKRQMIGSLSDAIWRRITLPGCNTIEALAKSDYWPVSDEEIKIWNELTSPQNRPPLLRYVECWRKLGTDLGTDRLHSAILAESARRWEMDNGRTLQQN